MKNKYFKAYEDATQEIANYLIEQGFKQNEDFATVQEKNERWLSFSLYDPANDVDLDINLDFDPYMHIDESDEEIFYNCPVYVQFMDNNKYFDTFGGFNDPEFVEDLEELKSLVGDFKNSHYPIKTETVENFPSWAINYLFNGDASDLTDEEVKEINKYLEDLKNCLDASYLHEADCKENGFSNYPAFGLPCDVEVVTFLYEKND